MIDLMSVLIVLLVLTEITLILALREVGLSIELLNGRLKSLGDALDKSVMYAKSSSEYIKQMYGIFQGGDLKVSGKLGALGEFETSLNFSRKDNDAQCDNSTDCH